LSFLILLLKYILSTFSPGISTKRRGEILQKSYKHLRKNEIKGFCSLIANVDLPSGASAMLEVVGVGKIMPNILFIGFKNDWRVCDKNSLSQYFATIQSVFLFLPALKSSCTHTPILLQRWIQPAR
jgi:hypothetical protein